MQDPRKRLNVEPHRVEGLFSVLALQRLKTSLTEHQPQLYQVLEAGKRLLLSVGCSDLENQLTQLGEHWLSSTTKVNKELLRLDSTLKHWSRSAAAEAVRIKSRESTF